jgi:hypothetical protein
MGTRPRLIAATLLSPTDKYWPLCQSKAETWADEHVILEDTNGDAWGDESTWRERLWNQALSACKRDDWIVVLDSDFILTFDPHILTLTDSSTAWRFPLYDLWDNRHYRSDNFWYGHKAPRYWMFRILHLGWLDEELRQEKYDRYQSIAHKLGEQERAHVDSILDDRPNLLELPEAWWNLLES